MAAGAAIALSVITDIGYTGKQGLTLLWMPFEFTALLVLTGRVIRWAPRYAFLPGAAAALTVLALPLRFTLRNPESGAKGSLTMILVTLIPVGCAIAVGSYLRAADERRRQAVLKARREQRLHMARTLHDFVAHELTGMLLEVQAAQTTAYDPEQYRALLGRLEESSLRALEQMDRTLHTLRDAEEGSRQEERHAADGTEEPAQVPTRVYGVADLPDLTARFAESSAIPTEVDVAEDLVGTLRRDTDETAYSMVLEALTNVRRHAAEATSVCVIVERADDTTLRVSVTDDGGHSGTLIGGRKGGGTGLVGLRERFAVLGGALEAGAAGNGWQVTGTLPLAPVVQPPSVPAVKPRRP